MSKDIKNEILDSLLTVFRTQADALLDKSEGPEPLDPNDLRVAAQIVDAVLKMKKQEYDVAKDFAKKLDSIPDAKLSEIAKGVSTDDW